MQVQKDAARGRSRRKADRGRESHSEEEKGNDRDSARQREAGRSRKTVFPLCLSLLLSVSRWFSLQLSPLSASICIRLSASLFCLSSSPPVCRLFSLSACLSVCRNLPACCTAIVARNTEPMERDREHKEVDVAERRRETERGRERQRDRGRERQQE